MMNHFQNEQQEWNQFGEWLTQPASSNDLPTHQQIPNPPPLPGSIPLQPAQPNLAPNARANFVPGISPQQDYLPVQQNVADSSGWGNQRSRTLDAVPVATPSIAPSVSVPTVKANPNVPIQVQTPSHEYQMIPARVKSTGALYSLVELADRTLIRIQQIIRETSQTVIREGDDALVFLPIHSFPEGLRAACALLLPGRSGWTTSLHNKPKVHNKPNSNHGTGNSAPRKTNQHEKKSKPKNQRKHPQSSGKQKARSQPVRLLGEITKVNYDAQIAEVVCNGRCYDLAERDLAGHALVPGLRVQFTTARRGNGSLVAVSAVCV